jgi:hypothetical protein
MKREQEQVNGHGEGGEGIPVSVPPLIDVGRRIPHPSGTNKAKLLILSPS